MVKLLVDLFFPPLCVVCCQRAPARHDEYLCLHCEIELPRAIRPTGEQAIAKAFWGRVPLTSAYAWLRFRHDNVAKDLLHAMKYGGDPLLGRALGRRFARELIRTKHFVLPDLLVPVPLHPKKLRERGFNQAETIAKGMQEVFGCALSTEVLRRHVHRSSLTKLSRTDRWEQIRDNYEAGEDLSAGHMMIVDDVITTGATIESCVRVVSEAASGRKCSVAALAYAERTF